MTMRQPYILKPVPDQFPAKVSIVIPCHNAINITMLSLTSVIHNSDIPFELVLVNDGSTDSTAASLDRLAANINAGQYPKVTGVRVLHNSKRTSCAEASNLGVAAASGDIIVWCNNDMLYGPHWLSPLVKIVATDANVGVVGPWPLKVTLNHNQGGSIVTEFAALAANHIVPDDPALFSSGAPFVFRRGILNMIGGYFFDERFAPAYFEDWDLYNRLLTAGLHFGLTRRSVYYHYEGITCNQLPDRAAIYHANRHRFLEKWPGGGPLLQYLGLSPSQLGL
jgi:GT2 family glycosyltransferase